MFGKLIRFVLQAIGLVAVIAAIAAVIAAFTLGHWLQYQDTLQKADYIVPLAGDDHRLLKAAELYKQGFAPTILLSNARVRPPSRIDEINAKLGHPQVGPREERKMLLGYLGVPEMATAEFGNGHVSTYEEAEALRAHIGSGSVTIILVTSPYHTRRAKLTFERVMPSAHFMLASPPEGQLHDPWWRDQDSALLVVTETAKLAYFWLGGVFRAPGLAPTLAH
jgi:uncharacterized SAM-binding protein YcdF (DUF218 family)